MLNLPYYKDLSALNLLNGDETQEIIKIVQAAGCCEDGMRDVRRDGGRGRRRVAMRVVGSGARGAWNCDQGRRACGLGEAPGVVALAGRDAG